MILPTKHLSEERSLLNVGGEIITLLDEPKTVSRLWDELKRKKMIKISKAPLSFDWYILTLDLLYTIGVIEMKEGKIGRIES